jgi:hypothetical protein
LEFCGTKYFGRVPAMLNFTVVSMRYKVRVMLHVLKPSLARAFVEQAKLESKLDSIEK